MSQWIIRCWITATLILIAVGIHTQAPLIALQCPSQDSKKYDYPAPENCAALDILVVISVRDLWLGSGRFIHRNRDDINAVSTLAIAVFTFTLWWVNRGMVRVARDQHAEMEKATAATQAAAEAAKMSADAVVALHLPRLVLSHIDFKGAGDARPRDRNVRVFLAHIMVRCTVKNYGRTPTFPTMAAVEATRLDILPTDPIYYSSKYSSGVVPSDTVIEEGGTYDIGLGNLRLEHRGTELKSWEIEEIVAGDKRLRVYGFVTYRDVWGNSHTHRFCKMVLMMPDGDTWYWYDSDETPESYTRSD